ncbi:MAG: YcxB family protein [Lachnospiraceae bacterium]|nr:YcxB family protein [Lachnospiraceae bacterium]
MKNELKFDVTLTAKDLWTFSMYHTNSGGKGVINVLCPLAALFALIVRWGTMTAGYRVLLVVFILAFTVWQPLLLYIKAAKQAKNAAVSKLMTLTFAEDGLKVEQDGQELVFTWEQMGRMDRIKPMIILYMDRVHAYLFPTRILGDKEEALCELARTHLQKNQCRHI